MGFAGLREPLEAWLVLHKGRFRRQDMCQDVDLLSCCCGEKGSNMLQAVLCIADHSKYISGIFDMQSYANRNLRDRRSELYLNIFYLKFKIMYYNILFTGLCLLRDLKYFKFLSVANIWMVTEGVVEWCSGYCGYCLSSVHGSCTVCSLAALSAAWANPWLQTPEVTPQDCWDAVTKREILGERFSTTKFQPCFLWMLHQCIHQTIQT